MALILNDMDTAQLIVAANVLAVGLSKGLNSNDTDILANFIVSIGDILALIASSKLRTENSTATTVK